MKISMKVMMLGTQTATLSNCDFHSASLPKAIHYLEGSICNGLELPGKQIVTQMLPEREVQEVFTLSHLSLWNPEES